MRLKSSSVLPLGITNAVPGVYSIGWEARGTQNKSRRPGPIIHPSTPSKKEVVLRSSSEVPSNSSTVLCSAWFKLDEKQMRCLFGVSVNAMVLSTVGWAVGLLSKENIGQSPSAHSCSCNGCQIAAYQSLTVSSAEPDTMRLPSDENDTELTQAECPCKDSPDDCPVAMFHSRTVLSYEPDRMRVPSGEKATDETKPVCPRKGSPTGCPVAVFHSRIVLSPKPDAVRVPPGENETELTHAVWPRKGSPHGCPVASYQI